MVGGRIGFGADDVLVTWDNVSVTTPIARRTRQLIPVGYTWRPDGELHMTTYSHGDMYVCRASGAYAAG